jgi:hypothetical protein
MHDSYLLVQGRNLDDLCTNQSGGLAACHYRGSLNLPASSSPGMLTVFQGFIVLSSLGSPPLGLFHYLAVLGFASRT